MAALIAASTVAVVAASDGPALVAAAVSVFVLGPLAAFAWWLPARIYAHWSYSVGDTAIEICHGAVIRRRSVIPFFRLQHVDTSRGPLERRLGLTELVLHTASSGTDARIPGLDEAEAEALREHILARAGLTEGV